MAVEFTLACRKAMRYRLLLGSKALIDGQLVVNPASSTFKTSRRSRSDRILPQVLHEDCCAVAKPASVFHPPPGRGRHPNVATKWW